MLQWRTLTGYRGRSSGCAQTCAMACICGSLYSCRASPSRDALCSRLVRVVTVRKLSSCCGRLHPRFLQPHDSIVLALSVHLEQDNADRGALKACRISAPSRLWHTQEATGCSNSSDDRSEVMHVMSQKHSP